MWLLLIKCKKMIITIKFVSAICLCDHMYNRDIPVLMLPVCCGGE